jgi:pimeloyl-ACP methyl ester carboxylesterase
MIDRFLVWLGAGMVTAGVAAAMVAGAGVAVADSPPGSDSKGTTSSESAKPTENKGDSHKDRAGAPKPKPSGDEPKKDAAADPKEPDDTGAAKQDEDEKTGDKADPPAQQPDEEPADATVEVTKPAGSSTAKKLADQSVKPTQNAHKPATKPTPRQQVDETTPQETTEATESPESKETTESTETVHESASATVVPMSRNAKAAATVQDAAVQDAAVEEAAVEEAAAPQTAAVTVAAQAKAEVTSTAIAPPLRALLSAIGTVVFNLYGLATRLVGGPPILPANSTVTVHSSTLRIDCGDGYEVPADWYVPDTPEPPTRLIYLQHGFLASGPWYSHTAAALAEQTKSIVVAPTITSNFLSCDACWLGAPPMQKAVADLFEDGNTALADSALAAGYTGPIPDRVVLVGHSLGGGLVAGTAGSMVDNGTADRLAGVVMLDGVGLDDSMTTSLEKVPDAIPIYQLAAPRYFWNQFGVGSDALHEARPDEFIGFMLAGGSHVDTMRGGNPLIQFSQQLVAGFSKPQNVDAAQILMVGWVNDMFACTHDKCTRKQGIYADPTDEIPIDTPAGQAIAIALPSSLTMPFLLDPLQALVPLGQVFFVFQPTCGPLEPTCVAASAEESVAA